MSFMGSGQWIGQLFRPPVPNPLFSPHHPLPPLMCSSFSFSFPPSVKLATEGFWRNALWMDCGGGRGCIEENIHRVIAVSPLGVLQMVTQGCFVTEGLKGADSLASSFILTSRKRRLCQHVCKQRSLSAKQSSNQK